MPRASTSSISKDEFINVSISSNEKIFLNSEEIGLKSLNEELQKINIQNNKKVIISGDKDVDYGRIIEVLDELRKIKNLKIAISTK